jgi:N utilization substance protein B
MMTERRRARKDALEILFENEIAERPIAEVIENRRIARDDVPSDFTLKIVNGINDNRERIDDIIRAHTDNWAIERMPTIDRNIIRIGLYEMYYEEDIPFSVTINEAVELAKAYGMEESSKFVNGILGRVAGELKEGLEEGYKEGYKSDEAAKKETS